MNRLEELNIAYMGSIADVLGLTPKDFVMGHGNADCPNLMLIGEAPGAQEVRLGIPFVGQAGENLNRFLRAVGIERSELYVSNTVKIRPTSLGPTGRLRNRPPSRQEKQLFRDWLLSEIALVRPQYLVTLGNTPLEAVMGTSLRVGDVHGTILQSPQGNSVFALYHPAAVIYNRALADVYEQDLRRLHAVLHRLH